MLQAGATLRFRCRGRVDGKPVGHQLVLAGGRAGIVGDRRLPAQSSRGDATGVVTVSLAKAGHWHVKCTHMEPVSDGRVDYESKWATITFEVR